MNSRLNRPSPQWLRQRRIALTLLAAIVLSVAFGVSLWLKGPPPAIPVPNDLDELEPQLRAYIAKKVEWARQVPRDPQRHATLGLVYAANALWHEAGVAFQNVAQLRPKEPLAHLYIAISAQESGSFAEALNRFRQVTVQFPDFAPGYYRLGDALLRSGSADDAGKAFQRLIELTPQEWRGHAGLGDVKLRQGRYAEAIRLLENAVALDSSAKRAHYLLGLAYRATGRREDAKLELSLGTSQTDFPMPDAWSVAASQHIKLLQEQIEMANEYSQAGQPDRAVEILETALRYRPNNFGLMNNLAIAYNHFGRPDLARDLLMQILKKDDRYLPACITLSHSCHALGVTNEALAYAEKAVGLSPNTAQPHLAKANALLGMERDVEALAALEAALRCDPQNAEIEMEMGDIHWLNLNQREQAKQHYLKAKELNLALAPVYIRLADLHLKLGEIDEAVRAVATLKKISPHVPEVAALEARLGKSASGRSESNRDVQ